jgi:hypothetical protein
MKYIGKIVFKTDDFDTTSASTLKDKLRPGCLGWIEYSIAYLRQGIHCFKKPNRFMDMFEKVEGYKQKFKIIHVIEILNGIVVHAVRGKQSE